MSKSLCIPVDLPPHPSVGHNLGAVWAGASDAGPGTPCHHVGVVMTHRLCLVCHTRNQIGTRIFWQEKKKAQYSCSWPGVKHLLFDTYQQAMAGFIMLSSSFSSKLSATLSRVSWGWQSKSSFSRSHTPPGFLLYIYFPVIPSLQPPEYTKIPIFFSEILCKNICRCEHPIPPHVFPPSLQP